MERIGVFGAGFNPPTLGHFSVISQALPHFERILLVPSLSHPFQKSFIAIEHRLNMLNLFLTYWKNTSDRKKIQVSLIEADIQKRQSSTDPIYTYDVLTALTESYANDPKRQPFEIQFIMGPDNAHPTVWQQFYRYQEIEKRWPLFIAQEMIPIHSTMVRDFLEKADRRDPRCLQTLATWVGLPIAEYILEQKLYVGR